jgi:hypothetical protein
VNRDWYRERGLFWIRYSGKASLRPSHQFRGVRERVLDSRSSIYKVCNVTACPHDCTLSLSSHSLENRVRPTACLGSPHGSSGLHRLSHVLSDSQLPSKSLLQQATNVIYNHQFDWRVRLCASLVVNKILDMRDVREGTVTWKGMTRVAYICWNYSDNTQVPSGLDCFMSAPIIRMHRLWQQKMYLLWIVII